ncbi:hypothetical protein HGP28_14265 [Vibrio sp. SM6]|uniref:Uncharacterized protein n=1 Tax=Vibrio agarilyticus TaxID=2726741 RepID=A0A7X8TSM1_9VIBR|nr:hypothetical protein [Vibrio agarilyticus]NLS14055.1 hypothetical protein [Vibrio agarilyticus]
MSFNNYWEKLKEKNTKVTSLEELVRYKKRSIIVPAGLPFKVNKGSLCMRGYNNRFYLDESSN